MADQDADATPAAQEATASENMHPGGAGGSPSRRSALALKPLPDAEKSRIAKQLRETRKARKLASQTSNEPTTEGAREKSRTQGKLSERDKDAWATLAKRDRIRKRIMMLAKTIMHDINKLNGRARPRQRIDKGEVEAFVRSTCGGSGSVPKLGPSGSGNINEGDFFGFFRLTSREGEASSQGEIQSVRNQVVPHGPASASSDSASGTPRLSGKIYFDERQADPTRYVIARTDAATLQPATPSLVHLLKFYAMYKWGLPRPGIIITVTGGAANFDLSRDAQGKILRGMMEGTRDLTPWFITGGTASGIMKYVGEARAKYNPGVPLIGIVPLGVIAGCEAIQERAAGRGGALGTYQEMKHKDSKTPAPAELDTNHTHFIFTTDESTPNGVSNFGKETKLRADFESCVGGNYKVHDLKATNGRNQVIRPYASGVLAREVEETILRTMKIKGIGWHGMTYREPSPKVSFAGIPVISICVQGGPNTIKTVLDATLNETPSLIVKGSGKAADLIADCVLARYSPDHEFGVTPDARDQRQKMLISFFSLCGLITGEQLEEEMEEPDIVEDIESDDYKCFRFDRVLKRLAQVELHQEDAAASEKLEEELRCPSSQITELKNWIDAYIGRADKLPRNFYGQTPRERREFFVNLDRDKESMILNYCDRKGLFCDIEHMKEGNDDSAKVRVLIHSRTERSNFVAQSSPVNRDPRPLDIRKWTQEDIITLTKTEKKCRELFESYDLKIGGKSPIYCSFLHKALSAALTRKCWVFDLYSNDPDAPDFKCSLLNCLVNGLGHPSADDETILGRKLSYAIKWGRDDVLGTVLEKTGLSATRGRSETLTSALIEAIGLNEVRSVETLLDTGANIDCFAAKLKTLDEEIKETIDLVKCSVQSFHSSPQDQEQISDEGTIMKEQSDPSRQARLSPVVLGSWGQLFEMTKRGPHARYMKAIESNVKGSVIQEDTADSGTLGRVSDIIWKTVHACFDPKGGIDKDESDRHHVDFMDLDTHKQLYHILTTQIKISKEKIARSEHRVRNRLCNEESENGKMSANADAHANDVAEVFKQRMIVARRLITLEVVYREMIGPEFNYKIGIQGPEFDLFLWSVLMNRWEMSRLFFFKCNWPVRCGITAACLLRNMSKRPEVDPITAREMMQNADNCEDLATNIQLMALKDDQQTAQTAIVMPIVIWRDMAIIDVAMAGGCERFVEECCSSTLDDMFTGDISPYGDDWITLKMCLAIGTLGLPLCVFPGMFKFNPPPRSEGIRSATQRRERPKGYPYNPHENPVLKKMYEDFRRSKQASIPDTEASRQQVAKETTFGQRSAGSSNSEAKPARVSSFRDMEPKEFDVRDFSDHFSDHTLDELFEKSKRIEEPTGTADNGAMKLMYKIEMDPSFVLEMTDEHLCELWEPTFTFYERWILFWCAPKVLYLSNVIMQMVTLLIFVILQQNYTAPWSPGSRVFLAVYFGSCTVREYMQMMVASNFVEYIQDFWNIVDVTSIIGFFLGMFTGSAAGHDSVISPDATSDGPESEDIPLGDITAWKMFYGVSLFAFVLRSLRVLAIFRKLGLLVLVFQRMMVDVASWLVVFLIFTLSFSVLLYDAGPREVDPNCLTGDAEVLASCEQAWWWFARTLVQSFGELFLEEMKNSAMFWIAIIAFIILNVVLMNLLIAMMSGTYEAVSAQANRQMMLDQYWIIKEHSRWALAMPPILNLVGLAREVDQFLRNYFLLRKKYMSATFWDLFDIFLSRNSVGVSQMNTGKTREDHIDNMRVMSFLERAKMAYIEREDGEIDSELLLLKTKIENISRQLERQGEHLDDRIERITRSMAATMKREIANTGKTLDATQVGSP